MPQPKQIYLLLGPKGSGKSFVGNLIQEEFGISFIRVEDWAKSIKRERSFSDDDYLSEVFQMIESGIRRHLDRERSVVFESTGLTQYFDSMLKSLKGDFKVTTIGVNADLKLCLHRVRTRDMSIHIDVSDERVNEINELVLKKNLSADYTIDNSNKGSDQLIDEIRFIIDQTRVS